VSMEDRSPPKGCAALSYAGFYGASGCGNHESGRRAHEMTYFKVVLVARAGVAGGACPRPIATGMNESDAHNDFGVHRRHSIVP
jgi:hypothetical protein